MKFVEGESRTKGGGLLVDPIGSGRVDMLPRCLFVDGCQKKPKLEILLDGIHAIFILPNNM